jgi:MFS family permease
MAGPLVGGFIVQHFSWHWALFINLPAGLLSLAGCRLAARPSAMR